MISIIKRYYSILPEHAKASIWFLFCTVLQKGITVITTPIFTRLLSTEEYGQLNVYNSWNSIITVIVTMCLFYGVLTQGIVRDENNKNQFVSSLLGLCSTMLLIWFLIYFLFLNFWNSILSLTSEQVICMFISIWSCSCFAFWSTDQRVDYKYKMMVLLTVVLSIVRPVMDYIIITNTQNRVMSKIIADTVLEFLLYSPLFLVLLKRGHVFFCWKNWKYAVLFNLPLVPHYLSQVLLSNCDRIMIDRMIGTDKAGIYGLAYSLSTLLLILNTSINSTMEPWLYRKIRDGKSKEISSVVYSLFIFVAILNLLLICFAPEAIAIFAPQEYYEAIYVIPPVAMSVYFQFTYVSFGVFEFYYKKTYFVTIATLSGAFVNIVLNYLFIRVFGYYAAGYTTLFCYMIFSILHYIFMKKIVKENLKNEDIYPLRSFLGITFFFLALGFLILCTYKFNYIRYCIIIIFLISLVIFRKKVMGIINSILRIRNKSVS